MDPLVNMSVLVSGPCCPGPGAATTTTAVPEVKGRGCPVLPGPGEAAVWEPAAGL